MPDRTRQKPPDEHRKKAPSPEASHKDEVPFLPLEVDYPGQADDKPVLEPGPQPRKRRNGGTSRLRER